MSVRNLMSKALSATKESRIIEFKESFDVNSPRDWCEIVKDIIAIANTEGGVILIGVNDRGHATRRSVKHVLAIDHADLVSKIYKYTSINFSDVEITERHKTEHRIAAFQIQRSPTPIVFTKPGTYDIGGGKQGRAFSEGTVYFRHGAKSAPGTTEDIRRAIEKRVTSVRKEMIRGVRRVVTAPTDSRVIVMPKEDVMESDEPTATPIRIVDDPDAPAYRKIDPAKSHPYLIDSVAAEIRPFLKGAKFGRYEIQAIRHVEKINENTRPDLLYRDKVHKSTSPQYSSTFIDFLRQRLKSAKYLSTTVEEYKRDMRKKAKSRVGR